jgi:hypothetical protein
MSDPYFAESIRREHEHDVRVHAARARLVAIVRCCRPSRLASGLRALRARMTARRDPVCC